MTAMKPLIALTMGDPAGIGPETIAAAWASRDLHAHCRAVVVGHPLVMKRAVQLVGTGAQVIPVDTVSEVAASVQTLPCLACCAGDAAEVAPATVDARGGQAAYDAVTTACRLALSGQVQAITTAPLNKAALSAAGHHYPGHTELLADLCSVPEVAMMLYLAPGPAIHNRAGLGVGHVTLHMALHDIFSHLTSERVLATCRLVDQVMRAMLRPRGADDPKIGVCALNPHAGEQQLFGDEEVRVIRPAVERGVQEGLALEGPLPADTLLASAAAGAFDGIVAMYHDQGHIALKLLDMYHAVNITLGLPIVRTSVAHGTAFDLAWTGQARWAPVVEAVRVAATLANRPS
jgi:4-hydroxythreonine-4-phosphate dehydrogenase